MNLDDLHDENGTPGRTGNAAVFGVTENNQQLTQQDHDVITGSLEDGTVAMGMTCNDWTTADDTATAMIGHLDGMGGNNPPPNAWNSEHPTGGCSAASISTPGRGLFYCFAL